MTGSLLGASGLLLGLLALRRARSAVRDCRTAVQRFAPDAGGVDLRSIRDIAMVRYDALEEMSGARSFSLAMLNTAGDGVVLTSINGRTESRTYAKIVEGGEAAEALSPEEYRAIRAARLGQGPDGSPTGGNGLGAVSVVPATGPGADGPGRPRAADPARPKG
ncbi:DUF4446 family protein [Actinorugispora endophytica]|uniref:DUF4446 family protein n=1 Tax=Actinorugispora endophytica TaxID=1605990 RepID=UPI001FB630AB|nr:DUF4446 family protein [Actinorugispora endophytica]